MPIVLTNNARSYLAASLTATDTIVRVAAGHGVRFPTLRDDGDWFPVAVEDASGNTEIMKAIDRSGDAITVERGAQPLAFAAGANVQIRIESKGLFDGS